MNVTGIVCEYNPFHRGHKFQIEKAKKLTCSDYIIAVMSGNFVQRGEPAILSKRSRVLTALAEGADMVIELPFPYVCSSAAYFASGAVSVLNSCGVVTHMAFGSESGDIEKIKKAASSFGAENALFKENSRKGLSYAKSSESATGFSKGESNDILASEYIRALLKTYSKITPVAIKRTASPSASEIREQIFSLCAQNASDDSVREYLFTNLSEKSAEICFEEYKRGRFPVSLKSMEKIIFSVLRSGGAEILSHNPNVSEGLENRIYSSSLDTVSVEELISSCTSSRYTSSRIKRVLVSAAVYGFSPSFSPLNPVPYVKILGMKKTASALASAVSENASVPVVTSNADAAKICPQAARIEASAADIYSLCFPGGISRGRSEYSEKFIII